MLGRLSNLLLRLIVGALLALPFLGAHAPAWGSVSRTELEKVFVVFQAAYGPELALRGEALGLNRSQFGMDWYDSPMVHASYVGLSENGVLTHDLTIFGGLLRLPEISVETAALILCHELGHGLGGPPYKFGGMESNISVEGQADFFAGSRCLRKIAPYWPVPNAREREVCRVRLPRTPEATCAFGLRAIEGFQVFLRRQTGVATRLWNPKGSAADRLELSPSFYPDPQCRIDTLLAGLSGDARPPCWFPGGSP